MEGKQSALNILTFVTTLKGQKILGRLSQIKVFKWAGNEHSCLDLASLFCLLFWATAKK
jgi:hypothetical protein